MTAAKKVGRRWTGIVGLLALGACGVGDGSEIGPRLAPLPDESCKVVVLDDQGRGVVGASVSIAGATAITGRNGRGELFANPRGLQAVVVDGRNAAAAAADTFPHYTFVATLNTRDLPWVLYVPELPTAASAVLPAGTQLVTTTITSTAGAQLQIAAGTDLGFLPTSTTIDVRLGDLAASHLPGELPVPTSGAWLFGRAVFVDPEGATFAPAASLDLADDLGIGSGTAQLFHLDVTTGTWQALGTGTASGGRITAANVVATGGLYAFAALVAATTVSGRVVDAAGAPVRDVLVAVDQGRTQTDGNGRFVVSLLPAALADGSPRSAAVELFAGGGWLPARRATTVVVGDAPVDTGDLALDTLEAGNIRVQQVLQGRREAFRPARLSSLRGDVALATTSDANGQLLFEDVPAEWFGNQDGRGLDRRDVIYSQAIGYLDRGRRWFDVNQFFYRRGWYQGGRRSRTLVCDALGGGPLENAVVVRGTVPGQGREGVTREGGALFLGRDFSGRATATRRSERDGAVIVHAFSIERPNGEHIELPLQRVLRTPLGAFERFGLVAGTVVGADPGSQHELRVTRRLSLQEWWDEIVENRLATAAAVPVDVDPAVTHADFVVGVPANGGNLVVTEFTSPGGLKTLGKVGIAADVVPDEGGRVARDVEFAAAATQTFVVPGALAGAPAGLDLSQLAMAVALQQPSGRIVDVARGLQGNHAAVGNDLAITLPPLTGELAGHGWLVLLDGSYVSDGTPVRCSTLLSLPRGGALGEFPIGDVTFASFPTIVSPGDGGVVPAAGFPVQFALPSGAVHAFVELRSVTGAETLLWQVLVPPERSEVVFVTLPADTPTPLLAGRTYTLTVSAFFGDGRFDGEHDPYEDLATFWHSIGATERGVTQVTRRSIQITTN